MPYWMHASAIQRTAGPASRQRGYALLMVTLMLAMVVFALARAVPSWTTEIQREHEDESITRAKEYVTGIKRYYHKFGAYPPSLDRLEATNGMMFLRRAWKDPLTGGDYKLIYYGQANPAEIVNYYGHVTNCPASGANGATGASGTPDASGTSNASGSVGSSDFGQSGGFPSSSFGQGGGFPSSSFGQSGGNSQSSGTNQTGTSGQGGTNTNCQSGAAALGGLFGQTGLISQAGSVGLGNAVAPGGQSGGLVQAGSLGQSGSGFGSLFPDSGTSGAAPTGAAGQSGSGFDSLFPDSGEQTPTSGGAAPNSAAAYITGVNPATSGNSSAYDQTSTSSAFSQSSPLGSSTTSPGQTLGGGPIIGVQSASKNPAIHSFNNYSEPDKWQWVYVPALDLSMTVGSGTTAVAPGATTNPAGGTTTGSGSGMGGFSMPGSMPAPGGNLGGSSPPGTTPCCAQP